MTEESFNGLTIDLTEDFWWVFYLKEPQSTSTLQPLFDEFTRLNLAIVDTYVSDPYVRMILHEEGGDMYFELSSPSDDVAPYLFLGTLDEYFVPPDSLEARMRADRFIEYGKTCYRFLGPVYAFAENLNTYIKNEDVQRHNLTHVCWAQFFGPDFVHGFGRETLLNAPAWRNENLGDGGILYVLAASPYLYRGPRQYWSAAREYFSRYLSSPLVWSDRPG